MTPSNNYSSSIPILNFSPMVLQDLHPSSPSPETIPNHLFPSRAYPASTDALSLPYHPNHLVFAPFGRGLPIHVRGHHVPQSVSVPTPQLPYHPEVRVSDINPRESTVAAYAHYSPIPTNHSPSTNAHPTLTHHPTTESRATTHPYTRITFRKKTRPAADYTSSVGLVQASCIADGGDQAVVNLLRTMFADGVSSTALTRRLTRDEAREYNNGARGQAFRVFLRADDEKRFHCRLCAVDADEGGWKHAKDALRHLKRDHFGLGTCCDRCRRTFYTTGEWTRHRCAIVGDL